MSKRAQAGRVPAAAQQNARALMAAQPDPPPRGPLRRGARRLLREALLPLVWLMEAGHRFGRTLFQTEYTISGACKRRGACCQHILLEWSPLFDRLPFLGRIVLWRMTRLHSFFDRGYSWEVQPGLLVRVLGCHALREDGLCGERRLRPLFCRTYPEVPLFGRPAVLKGCGYHFLRRDGQAEPPAAQQPIEGRLVTLGGKRREDR